MKKLLIVGLVGIAMGLYILASAATYDEFSKEVGELKVGKVSYENYSMEKLLKEKANIERYYQGYLDEYNARITWINKLISEAQALGVTLSP